MTVALREEPSMDMLLQDVETMQKMCAALMKTKHYQKMGEDGIFAIIQKAKSIGINPLEALNGGLYFLQGKIGMSSEMMASLIRQQGHSVIKDERSNEKICILKGKRADNGDTWSISFSMDDARRAGLAKNMYEKYPAVMLYNRAMSMLARQLFPDVIKGAGYTMEELREISDNKRPTFNPSQHEKVQSLEYAKFEEVAVEISDEQASLLQFYLDGCAEERQSQFNEWLEKSMMIKSVDKITTKDFDRIERILKAKYEENQSQHGEEEEVQHAVG